MKRRKDAPFERIDHEVICEIPTDKFYGTPVSRAISEDVKKRLRWRNHLRKLEKIEAEFKSNPLIESYRSRIDDPCILRQTFFRQSDAFEFVKKTSDDLHVFSYESPKSTDFNSGKRLYLACSYVHFYHYYKQLKEKHHYEIIPEGAPCRLYFDLEYSIKDNPGRNGDEMVDTLIKVMNYKLKSLYDVDCHSSNVVDLEATTDKKFSRHLIFHLPHAVFCDNINAGHFVNHVCAEIQTVISDNADDGTCTERLGTSLNELKTLLVKNKDGDDTFFCDLAVYTKNRNFRLLHSTKAGRMNPLEMSSRCRFTKTRDKDGQVSPRQFFLDTLISNVRLKDETRLLTCDVGCRLRRSRLSRTSSTAKTSHVGPSPYPEIDDFVRRLIGNDVIQDGGDYIRRWTYFDECEVILYEIQSYRYCENIKRHHRSNNIMLLVDLRRGVFYQKCHDPDCRRINYKSPDYPVPDHLLPRNYLKEGFDSDFEKDNCVLESDDQNHDIDEHYEMTDQELLNATSDF